MEEKEYYKFTFNELAIKVGEVKAKEIAINALFISKATFIILTH